MVITLAITILLRLLENLGILPLPHVNVDTNIYAIINRRIIVPITCILLFVPLLSMRIYSEFFISYKIEGEIKFFELYLKIVDKSTVIQINYDDLNSIVIDYYNYYGSRGHTGIRKSGASNKITINYGANAEFKTTFLCKKHSDIKEIERVLLNLNKQWGTKIIEYYRGRMVGSY